MRTSGIPVRRRIRTLSRMRGDFGTESFSPGGYDYLTSRLGGLVDDREYLSSMFGVSSPGMTESEERQLMIRLEELAKAEGLREDKTKIKIPSSIQAQIDSKADDSQVLKHDGSVTLSTDWDIGDAKKILADQVKARDIDGLALYDDGGKGIFIRDGGSVGIGTTAPGAKLEICDPNPAIRIRDSDNNGGMESRAFIEFGQTESGVWSRTGYVGDGFSLERKMGIVTNGFEVTISVNGGVSFALTIDTDGNTNIAGNLDHDGSGIGFYGTVPIAKPTVTGSRGGNAALASLLTALANLGLITDNTT